MPEHITPTKSTAPCSDSCRFHAGAKSVDLVCRHWERRTIVILVQVLLRKYKDPLELLAKRSRWSWSIACRRLLGRADSAEDWLASVGG